MIIAAVLGRTWLAVLFALMMFVVATFTAAGRVGARHDWSGSPSRSVPACYRCW